MNNAHQSRARRFDLSFPLQFGEGSSVVKGHCLNLSESGLLGIFDQALEVWTSGEVLLLFAGESVRLSARVARVQEFEAGLAFTFHNDAERGRLSDLLTRAARMTHLTGKPPF